MRTDFWRAAKLLLTQLLNLNINEQLVREVDYLMAENQVLKNQITTNQAAREVPQFECRCGTLGKIGKK